MVYIKDINCVYFLFFSLFPLSLSVLYVSLPLSFLFTFPAVSVSFSFLYFTSLSLSLSLTLTLHVRTYFCVTMAGAAGLQPSIVLNQNSFNGAQHGALVCYQITKGERVRERGIYIYIYRERVRERERERKRE